MNFTNLEVENWRNFRKVNVPLSRRAFIVGANASGKSNLLDVFKFLRDIAEPEGSFQRAVKVRGSCDGSRSAGAHGCAGRAHVALAWIHRFA